MNESEKGIDELNLSESINELSKKIELLDNSIFIGKCNTDKTLEAVKLNIQEIEYCMKYIKSKLDDVVFRHRLNEEYKIPVINTADDWVKGKLNIIGFMIGFIFSFIIISLIAGVVYLFIISNDNDYRGYGGLVNLEPMPKCSYELKINEN